MKFILGKIKPINLLEFYILGKEILVEVPKRNNFKIKKDTLLCLHKNFNDEKGAFIERGVNVKDKKSQKFIKDGIMTKIEKNKEDKITIKELKHIFGDYWFLVFGPIEKLQKEIKERDFGHSVSGSIRGINSKALDLLVKYITKNILGEGDCILPQMNNNCFKNAKNVRKYFNFDLIKYRSLSDNKKIVNNKQLNYLIDKLEENNLWIFKIYNYPGILPLKFNKTDEIDGASIKIKNNLSIAVSPPKSFHQRSVTTILTLLRSLQENGNKISLIDKKYYTFAVSFLLTKEEIQSLKRKNINKKTLKEHAIKYGISESCLNSFLHFEANKEKFNQLNKKRLLKNSPGGPGWDTETRFKNMYSKKLYKVKKLKIIKNLKNKNKILKIMAPKIGTKEKNLFIKKNLTI